ncbi:isochorismate synthase [Spiractinospora alimapuensis]|uniref:isochorismate synthase n=1 Tax=Spiractinospora alimapuensis TaxID=2820884 RepID=UPI001F01E560|nr:isochorismate synthase [Spiractinospora alimapuensis]
MDHVAESPEHLSVRTVELPDEAAARALVDLLPEDEPMAWLRNGEGIVGWGVAARLVLPDEPTLGGRRFAEARRWFSDLTERADVVDTVGLAGCGLTAFTSFTFDRYSRGSLVVVPRVLVGRRDGRSWITTVGTREEPPPSPDIAAPDDARPIGDLRWTQGTLGPRRWAAAVAGAVQRIRDGALDKVVLARDTVARASGRIDVRTLLRRLTRDYADCYTYSVGGLVGSTPELLLRRGLDPADQGLVESLVLAGTRPRGTTPEDDEKLADELATSVKDSEEHRYAIDSLNETLAGFCSSLDLPAHPELLAVNNVWHLASPVRASLRSGVSTLDVVERMHPTAAVGGTPTAGAVDLIRDLEEMDRGRYAGPVGWMDAEGRGEWGIALRCAQVEGSRARLFAGCGIVAGSDPVAELAEADTKFRVMREALIDPRENTPQLST